MTSPAAMPSGLGALASNTTRTNAQTPLPVPPISEAPDGFSRWGDRRRPAESTGWIKLLLWTGIGRAERKHPIMSFSVALSSRSQQAHCPMEAEGREVQRLASRGYRKERPQ